MSTIDLRAQTVDLTVPQGSALAFTVTAVTAAGSAVDLSAATIAAQIVDASGAVVDSFTTAVGGAGSNVITVSFSAAETAAITEQRRWQLLVTRSGSLRPWIGGIYSPVPLSRSRTSSNGLAITATIDADVTVTVGTDGVPGQGVPIGGTEGQVLAKIDGTDYNTEWITGGASGATLEQMQDDLGNTSLVAGTSLTKVYDDTAGTITLNVDAADFDPAGSAAAAQAAAIAASDPVGSAAAVAATLGTAAAEDVGAFATAAQGTLAANALPASDVSTFGGTLIDDADAATARTTLGLGTAATTASTDYATAAQGVLAGTATQPGDLGTLAVQDDIAVPGDITATGTASATTFLRGDGAWATPAGGGSSFVRPITLGSTWVCPNGAGFAGGEDTFTLPFRRLYYCAPWTPLADHRITAVMLEVTSALASGLVRLGLVELDVADGQPSALVADWGTIDASTTGLKSVSSLTTDVTAGKWYANIVYSEVGGGNVSARKRVPMGAGSWGVNASTPNRQVDFVLVAGNDYSAGFTNPPADWDTQGVGLNGAPGPSELILYRIGATP